MRSACAGRKEAESESRSRASRESMESMPGMCRLRPRPAPATLYEVSFKRTFAKISQSRRRPLHKDLLLIESTFIFKTLLIRYYAKH